MPKRLIENCDDAIFHIHAHFEAISSSCREHIRNCDSCRREYQDNVRFSQQLQAASIIRPPDSLEAKILMQVDAVDNKIANQQWLAMVASVTIMVVVFSFITLNYKPAAADLVVRHLDHFHTHTRMAAISSVEVDKFLQSYDIKIETSRMQVSHAQSCLIDGHEGAHLVFNGYQAPVIMIVLPKIMTREQTFSLQSQNYQGVMLALDSHTVALASKDPDSLAAFYADVSELLPESG